MVLDDSIDNLWRNRDFRLYFCAVFMATLANQIQSVAVAWQIYAIARSPLALGYVGLAQFLPIAALFFVAGDIADRYNRRKILAISYVVQVLATASLLVLTFLSAKSQWPFTRCWFCSGAPAHSVSPLDNLSCRNW